MIRYRGRGLSDVNFIPRFFIEMTPIFCELETVLIDGTVILYSWFDMKALFLHEDLTEWCEKVSAVLILVTTLPIFKYGAIEASIWVLLLVSFYTKTAICINDLTLQSITILKSAWNFYLQLVPHFFSISISHKRLNWLSWDVRNVTKNYYKKTVRWFETKPQAYCRQTNIGGILKTPWTYTTCKRKQSRSPKKSQSLIPT